MRGAWICGLTAGSSRGVWDARKRNEDIKRTSSTWRRPFRSYSSSLAVGYGGDQPHASLLRPMGPWPQRRGRHSSFRKQSALSRLGKNPRPPPPSSRFFDPLLDFLSRHRRCTGAFLTRTSIRNLPRYQYRSSRSSQTRPQLDHYPPCLRWNAQSPSPKSL